MPYVIISTVALFSNLYKNAPLVVGDKDSDPELMRYLGARMTTNYPACGSPPMYVMHAPPRAVFDNLEKRGYCLLATQTIQEHAVWVLGRPRVPEDDKTEILRGGPNDKAIQTNLDEIDGNKDSGESKKKPEKTTFETGKNNTTEEAVKQKKTVDPQKSIKASALERIDKYTQSDIDLSSSKGDHAQLKSILRRDNSNFEFGQMREKSINDLYFSRQSKTNLFGKQKLAANIGKGNNPSGSLLLLDGCTQTGYGDIARPSNIPSLPKVILTEPCTTPWKKASVTSLTDLISEIHEEPNASMSKPCGASVSPLLEGNPIFANIPDRSHLGCLTQCEGCCCEE